MKFADAHCHVHAKTFYNLWRTPHRHNPGLFTPWTILINNDRAHNKGKRAGRYTQSDLVKLSNGNVRLVINALYPFEKGFFRSPDTPFKKKNFARHLLYLLSAYGTTGRDILRGFIMDLNQRTINFLQSPEYDYWETLKQEKEFVLVDNKKEKSGHIHPASVYQSTYRSRNKRYKNRYVGRGTYVYPASKQELTACLQNPSVITKMLTIEGIHALGSDTETEETVINRIDEIRKWPVPVFFITFAHHFDNGLCGHAHSFPWLPSKLFLNQKKRMNADFTESGLRIARHLLAIKEDGTNIGKDYRILLDLKHMAASSRKDYYDKIIKPAMNKGNIIPVIASHVGYSGIDTLDALIRNQKKERDKKKFNGGFLKWNINVCTEDLLMIVRTKGIVGLNFDQRILGVPKRKRQVRDNNIDTIWRNLKAMVEAIQNTTLLNPEEKGIAWDIFCIGTDFDGYIDPINTFPSALEFELFARKLQEKASSNTAVLGGLSAQEMVEKVCYSNLEEFVVRNYPEKR